MDENVTQNKQEQINDEIKNQDDLIIGKCINCGSTVRFNPDKQCLVCDNCGSTFKISKSLEKLKENDFSDYVQKFKHSNDNSLSKANQYTLTCEDCGATITIDKFDLSVTCPFCGSHKTLKQDANKEIVIPIEGIIPFMFSLDECNKQFTSWLHNKALAPNKLKKGLIKPEFVACYLPFWTYDANTFSSYSAMRGTYYYVTVSRYNPATKQTEYDRERRINWVPVHGTYDFFFNDVVIRGSENKLDEYINKVTKYDLKKVVKYDEKYVLGYRAERSSLDLVEGFTRAKNVMQNHLRYLIRLQIGGDEVSNLKIDTNYQDITFKQLLCPIYLARYKVKGKKNYYYYVINGENGNAYGDYPMSTAKILSIVFSILAFILFLILAIYFATR